MEVGKLVAGTDALFDEEVPFVTLSVETFPVRHLVASDLEDAVAPRAVDRLGYAVLALHHSSQRLGRQVPGTSPFPVDEAVEVLQELHLVVEDLTDLFVAELAIDESDKVWEWMKMNGLKYNINGKGIQKICDSFRITDEWKAKFKELRAAIKNN